MTAKWIGIFLGICAFVPALAFGQGQCQVTRECYLGICDFPIPPSATCGNPGGGINGYFCTWSTNQCPVTTTTCTRCTHSASPSPGEGGAPINLATGDVYVGQADVAIPGLGGGMSLFRTWNSILPPLSGASSSGMFGLYWRSNFEERISLGSDGLFKYFLGNGDVWSFGYSGYDSGSNRFLYDLAAPANGSTSFKVDSTVWTITYKDSSTKTFDPTTGVLKTISDRNGNTTVLSYDGSNRLVNVTDPAGRHLYFAYGTGNASYLVNGVTSDFGIALSYAYDSQGRLTSVTRPDTTTISFEYNTQSLITAVKDSDSKVLESHTYDSQGRGLTSSRANGVEAISVSYEKPAPPTGP
jgi:YD repeat-containing protein